MKLASYRDGARDGHLVVVSRDLSTAHFANGIATRMQQVLDDWNYLSPQLQDLYETLNHGKARHAFAFDSRQCLAPLPRAGLWAYAVEGQDEGESADESDLRMTFDAANDFASATDAIGCLGDAPVMELRLAAVMGDVPRGAHGGEALEGVRLLMLATTAAFGADRPFTACSAVAVTPDELAPAWSQGRVSLAARRQHNGRPAGERRSGDGKHWALGTCLANLCAQRPVRAGSIVAAAPWVGASMEAAAVPLQLGDTITHELFGIDGLSVFGCLDQALTPRD